MEKFRLLFPKGVTETPENITELLEKMKMDNTTYQIGKTQVNIVYRICNLMWSELLTLQEADAVSLNAALLFTLTLTLNWRHSINNMAYWNFLKIKLSFWINFIFTLSNIFFFALQGVIKTHKKHISKCDNYWHNTSLSLIVSSRVCVSFTYSGVP